jgi:hypothetical protein
MGNRKRVTAKKVGLFLANPSYVGGGAFPMSMDNPSAWPNSPTMPNVGPGEPGPGDEWHVPTGPAETEDDVILEPVHSDGVVVLPLHPTDKR